MKKLWRGQFLPYDDLKKTQSEKTTEASASVCLALAKMNAFYVFVLFTPLITQNYALWKALASPDGSTIA